jgi:hypothetical protein
VENFFMGQSVSVSIAGHAFDTETINLLRSVLDRVWSELPEWQRNGIPRSLIAERLLRAAAGGERDPDVLRSCALGEARSATERPRPIAGAA